MIRLPTRSQYVDMSRAVLCGESRVVFVLLASDSTARYELGRGGILDSLFEVVK